MAAPWENFRQPVNLQVGPWTQFAPSAPEPPRELTEDEKRARAADERVAKERKESPGWWTAVGDTVRSVERGVPILGSLLDEGNAAISAAANWATGGSYGQPYDQALEYYRGQDRATDEAHPVASTVGKFAGGLAVAPITPFISGATTLGKIVGGAATGLGYGAAHGFGEGEGGFGNRLDKAEDYAAFGAGVGAGIPVLAAGAGGLLNAGRQAAPWIAARLPGRNADRIADDIMAQRMERSGITPQATAADLAAGQEAARLGSNSQARLPEMIADTSDSMQRLTGSVYRQGGRAGEMVRDAIETRQRGDQNPLSRFSSGDTGQRGQVEDALSRALQLRTADTARTTEQNIIRTQKAEGARLYEEARANSEPFNLQGVIDGMALRIQEFPPGISGQLQRAVDLFTQPLKKGAADAELAMMTKLRRMAADFDEKIANARTDQVRERLARRYATVMRRGQEDLNALRTRNNIYSAQRQPVDNIARFDAAKQELDDMIESAQRGGENNLARLLTGFKNDLLEAVHMPDANGNPTRNLKYHEARNAWGSAAENREALDLGRAALRDNSEVSLEQYRALTPGQKVFFRQGFLESARNALGRKRSGNDATLPFQEARVQDLLREIIPNTPGENAVFADRSGRFGEYLRRQERMGQTRNRVLGNSATEQRRQDDAEFAADALSRVLMGLRGGANIAFEFLGSILQRATAYRQDVAEALARRLIEADPAQQAALLRALQNRIGPTRFQLLLGELNRAIPAAESAFGGGDQNRRPAPPASAPADNKRFQPPMRLGGPRDAAPTPSSIPELRNTNVLARTARDDQPGIMDELNASAPPDRFARAGTLPAIEDRYASTRGEDAANYLRSQGSIGSAVAPVAGSILDYGGIPAEIVTNIAMQPVRAGNAVGEAFLDPTLANVTNAGFQTALAVGRPLAAGAALAGGLGEGMRRDLGADFSSPAVAKPKEKASAYTPSDLPGLTPEQNASYNEARRRLQTGAYANGAERRTLEAEVNRLSDQSSRMMEADAAAKRGLETARKAKEQEEYDRAVANAEEARDKELRRKRRFSETEFGKVYDKTGGAGAFGAAFLGGAAHGAFKGAEGAMNKYVLPAIEGTGLAFSANSIPLGYDAFLTDSDNPEKAAYLAYARELPPNHPRKQEFLDYANSLPDKNPVRDEARKEYLEGLPDRIAISAVEGIPSAFTGATLGNAARGGATGAANAATNIFKRSPAPEPAPKVLIRDTSGRYRDLDGQFASPPNRGDQPRRHKKRDNEDK